MNHNIHTLSQMSTQDLSIVDQRPSKYSIGVYENMVRYTVIAQHDGLKMDFFDFKTNKDRMTEWMGDLRQKQYG